MYLFGKVRVRDDPQATAPSSAVASEPQYTSCCVVVKNINRSMFVLPALTGENDDEGKPKRYGMVSIKQPRACRLPNLFPRKVTPARSFAPNGTHCTPKSRRARCTTRSRIS